MRLTMSMSTPASSATLPASAREAATPWFSSSLIAVQSLTTNPLKPHSRRSSVVMSHVLAALGPAPASVDDVTPHTEPARRAARDRGADTAAEVRLATTQAVV